MQSGQFTRQRVRECGPGPEGSQQAAKLLEPEALGGCSARSGAGLWDQGDLGSHHCLPRTKTPVSTQKSTGDLALRLGGSSCPLPAGSRRCWSCRAWTACTVHHCSPGTHSSGARSGSAQASPAREERSRGDEGGMLPRPGRVGTRECLAHVGTVGLALCSWQDSDTAPGLSHPCCTALRHGGAEVPGEVEAATEGPGPAPSLRGTMALGRGDACRAQWAAAVQAALCKATAGHRQLVLQLGGSADGPRLREERCRRSAEARELSTGLQYALLAGLRQAPASPEERRELERLWVLFLSALELFLQDLHRAHYLCQLFSTQGGGAAPLRTGLGGRGPPSRKGSRREGGPTQPLAALHLEEEIEQVRATLAEMESRANIPPWTVEATQPVGTGGTAAPAAEVSRGGPHTGHCCSVL